MHDKELLEALMLQNKFWELQEGSLQVEYVPYDGFDFNDYSTDRLRIMTEHSFH